MGGASRGRDGSVGRPDGRRAPSVGLTNGAVGAVGVGCTVAWAAKMHALSLVLRGFGYEIAPAARCFCFLNRGPGPSLYAGTVESRLIVSRSVVVLGNSRSRYRKL